MLSNFVMWIFLFVVAIYLSCMLLGCLCLLACCLMICVSQHKSAGKQKKNRQHQNNYARTYLHTSKQAHSDIKVCFNIFSSPLPFNTLTLEDSRPHVSAYIQFATTCTLTLTLCHVFRDTRICLKNQKHFHGFICVFATALLCCCFFWTELVFIFAVIAAFKLPACLLAFFI